MAEIKKIILLIDCSSEYDRRLLRGLVQYSKEHGPWLFYRLPSDYIGDRNAGEYVIKWARKWGADAIIGRWRWDDPHILASLGIPIVLQNYSQRSDIFSNLTGNYYETGEMAANFFLDRGYSHLAYFGVRNVIWSEERLEGYGEKILEAKKSLNTLLVDNFNQERDTVVSWLHLLPKPSALFACDDAYALFMAETCKAENISIPDEIALLGVDNDELLCQISDPQISTIELKVEEGGYKLGQIIDKQINTKKFWPFSISIEPGKIIERNSTKIHNFKDPAIEKVIKYIDRNFDHYITMDDIFQQIPMSRRNLEMRFKKEMGPITIYKYLISKRMEKMAQLLSNTSFPIEKIAQMCGIVNNLNISRTFKKLYGCSPLKYRRNNNKTKNRTVEDDTEQD